MLTLLTQIQEKPAPHSADKRFCRVNSSLAIYPKSPARCLLGGCRAPHTGPGGTSAPGVMRAGRGGTCAPCVSTQAVPAPCPAHPEGSPSTSFLCIPLQHMPQLTDMPLKISPRCRGKQEMGGDDCACLERANILVCLCLPSRWCRRATAKQPRWVAAGPARGTNALMPF